MEETTLSRVGLTLTLWISFSVLVALLPIAFNGLSALTRSQSVGYADLIGRGELLLVTVAITAAATGELYRRDIKRLRPLRAFLTAMGTIILCACSYWFAIISAEIQAGYEVDQAPVTLTAVFFLCGIAISGCAVFVSEVA